MQPTLDLDQRASFLNQLDRMFERMLEGSAQNLTKETNPFAPPVLANTNGDLVGRETA